MFNDIDDKFNDIFSEQNRHSYSYRGMDYQRILYISGGVFLALLLLGCCCRRRRSRGTVLTPAPVTTVVTTTPAPYPQQQYIVSGPVGYPPPQTAYPSYSAAPAPGPMPPHNPPYPSSTYPYPAPYVQQPQPYPSAPSAPDANALPPPYEQVCAKQPPYNQATH